MNSINRSRIAGGVVLNKNGEVIVVSQNGDSWSLPKGHVEEGESLLDAARREIYEESGVRDLAFVRELGTYERFRLGKGGVGEDTRERKIITMFLFRTDERNLAPRDLDNPEARWVPKADVANLLSHPKDQEFFRDIVEKI